MFFSELKNLRKSSKLPPKLLRGSEGEPAVHIINMTKQNTTNTYLNEPNAIPMTIEEKKTAIMPKKRYFVRYFVNMTFDFVVFGTKPALISFIYSSPF